MSYRCRVERIVCAGTWSTLNEYGKSNFRLDAEIAAGCGLKAKDYDSSLPTTLRPKPWAKPAAKSTAKAANFHGRSSRRRLNWLLNRRYSAKIDQEQMAPTAPTPTHPQIMAWPLSRRRS